MTNSDLVRYVIEPGEECPAIVTKRLSSIRLHLRLILSEEQVGKYGDKDGWWSADYLKSLAFMPWEGHVMHGRGEGEWYEPEKE